MFPDFKKGGIEFNAKWAVLILFQILFTRRIKKRNHIKLFGNYYLYKHGINKDSIVYSFGIGNNIRFDAMVNKIFGCKIYCYDPTPQSVEYMAKFKDDPRFEFVPKGVFHKKGTFKLWQPSNLKKINSSLIPIFKNKGGSTVEVECDTIPNFMKENGHTHIDILKMDIEGVAVDIMHQLIKYDIKPKQIAVELEIFGFRKSMTLRLKEFYKLIQEYKRHGYEVFYFDARRSRTVELLFVRKDIFISAKHSR